jgi:hypothetical protein
MEVDAGLHARMARHNFAPWHSGGGCMGWLRGDDREYWLITNEELGLDDGGAWIVGRYVWGPTDESWVTCDEPVPLDRALQLVDLLPTPDPTDPERTMAVEELDGAPGG